MLFTNIRGLKAKTSEFIKKTEEGEEVVVTCRGKPVALIRRFTEDEIEDYILNHPKFLAMLDTLAEECERSGKDFRDLINEKRAEVE